MANQPASHSVQRIVAPNAGPMTGGGTNTWIIGAGPYIVIDPGPAIDSHIDAIYTIVGEQLAAIFLTHTHRDHSPAAMPLANKTGAKIYGKLLEMDDGHQDDSVVIDTPLNDRERYEFDDIILEAVATPGHVDNHFCFYLHDNHTMFTGDHMMHGSTVVIIPPSGRMGCYIDSLRKMDTYDLEDIAPGHGDHILEPKQEIKKLIAHRLGREAKVLNAVYYDRAKTLDELTEIAYIDVPRSLYPIAKYSLLAHLIKLESDGLVQRQKGRHWLADEDTWLRI